MYLVTELLKCSFELLASQTTTKTDVDPDHMTLRIDWIVFVLICINTIILY